MNKSITFSVIVLTCFILIANVMPNYQASEPSFLSIVPPLLSILSAFILREVIASLFLGILSGAWLINGSTLNGFWNAIIEVPSRYTVNALYEQEHLKLILLTLFIGGMMSVIYANGGMKGLVKLISRWATNRKKGQLSTALIGFVIFFDDYSNTLVVGNTMRPLTDRLKISREKLAYIVDSTAAPLASIAVISLWVGFQVGLIESAIATIPALDKPFLLYLHSIAYSFYPILTLLFVFMIILTGKDFGPMLTAEKNALATKTTTETNENKPSSSALNAIIPILVLITTVITCIGLTGSGNTIREILGSADPFFALLIGGFFGSIVAIIMSTGKKLLSLEDAIDSWVAGVNSVTAGVIILVLSWSLAQVTQELNTANYLVNTLGDTIPYALFPTCVFIVAALIALGTGSSWGTMAILMPLTIPLCWQLIGENILLVNIIYASISAVLAGSVWGDHCSPISDTTILSSMACKCSHIEHVRTQMPYAICVGVVTIIFGLMPIGFGLPWWLALILSLTILYFIIHFWGESASALKVENITKQTETINNIVS